MYSGHWAAATVLDYREQRLHQLGFNPRQLSSLFIPNKCALLISEKRKQVLCFQHPSLPSIHTPGFHTSSQEPVKTVGKFWDSAASGFLLKEKKRKQQPGAPQGDMSSLLLTDTCFLDKPRHGCVGLLSPPVEPRNRRTRMLRGSREQSACLLWKGLCHLLASDQRSAESYTEAGVWRKDLALVSVSNSLERCKVTSNSPRRNEF